MLIESVHPLFWVPVLTESVQPLSKQYFGHNSLFMAWRTLIQDQPAAFEKKKEEEEP